MTVVKSYAVFRILYFKVLQLFIPKHNINIKTQKHVKHEQAEFWSYMTFLDRPIQSLKDNNIGNSVRS